jgi:hypothetical protein
VGPISASTRWRDSWLALTPSNPDHHPPRRVSPPRWLVFPATRLQTLHRGRPTHWRGLLAVRANHNNRSHRLRRRWKHRCHSNPRHVARFWRCTGQDCCQPDIRPNSDHRVPQNITYCFYSEAPVIALCSAILRTCRPPRRSAPAANAFDLAIESDGHGIVVSTPFGRSNDRHSHQLACTSRFRCSRTFSRWLS